MSVLKFTGWRWVGRAWGCLFTFVLLLLLVTFLFALAAAIIGAFFEGIGAAPGAALAGQIAFVAMMFTLYAVLLLLLLATVGVLLDALINSLGRLIFGGGGSFVGDVKAAWDGLGDGLFEGFGFVVRSLAQGWKDTSYISDVPIIGPWIDALSASRVPKPCPSTTNIQLAFTHAQTERDYPFGKNGAEIQQDAVTGAEAGARAGAEAAVTAEIDRIQCAEGCSKYVISRDVRLDGQTQVAVATGRVWDTYEATATALGSAVVLCSPEPPLG